MQGEPFGRMKARKLIREIVVSGDIFVGDYARIAMNDDELDDVDLADALRTGVIPADGIDLINGTYRYRVETDGVVFVVNPHPDPKNGKT